MKVCVMTKAKPFAKEEYVGVFASAKAADKNIKSFAPNARKEQIGSNINYTVKVNNDITLFFIRMEDVKE